MLHVHPPHPSRQAEPHSGAVWLDLVGPSESEISLVEDFVGCTLPSRDDLAGIEQSSRLSFEDGVLRMAAPMIAGADTDHPSISHVGLILTPRLLISIRYDALPMFDAVAGKAAADEPHGAVAIFAALIDAFVARQADLLEEARARLDQISHQVFRKSATSPRRAAVFSSLMRDKMQLLGRLGERTSMIRESLLAVERMLSFVMESPANAWFAPEISRRLGVARADIDALNQFEEHLLGKVQFLLDAVLGFISIEQNDIFKVLTIASVVGIFPTLVAGWYGMNFHNMPEYGWAFGYQFGIGMIVASTILPLLWFKWRGWL
jgi:magnesium transporter